MRRELSPPCPRFPSSAALFRRRRPLLVSLSDIVTGDVPPTPHPADSRQATIKVGDSTLARRMAQKKRRTKRPALISLLHATGGDGWAHRGGSSSTIDKMTRARAIAPPSAATAKSPLLKKKRKVWINVQFVRAFLFWLLVHRARPNSVQRCPGKRWGPPMPPLS